MSEAPRGRAGLPRIQTDEKAPENIQQHVFCSDDSAQPVKAQTVDELHSLQKKKSAPTTPMTGDLNAFTAAQSDQKTKQQLQSIKFTY